MSKVTLTAARIEVLQPRMTPYDVRDAALRGFGIRVLPSGGKRFFVHCQHRGERVWKIVGDAAQIRVDEARVSAAGMLAAIRRGENVPCSPGKTLLEPVAGTVFARHARLWKPGTLRLNRSHLRSKILPHFAGPQIADIDRREVQRWFASVRPTSVAADRSMPVLSDIMTEAEAMGMRPEDSNPCRGIRRYRRRGRERFLSDGEIRRLSARLEAHEACSPRQVAVIRLLLLTGCRKIEILTLRWSELSRRPSRSPRFKDGSAEGPAWQPGPCHSRSAASRHKPVRVSRSPRPRPSARAQPLVVASGQARRRHRRCPPP